MNGRVNRRLFLATGALALTASVAAAQIKGGAAPTGDDGTVDAVRVRAGLQTAPQATPPTGGLDGPGLSADFEAPNYVGSAAGTLLTGQQSWINPVAGSVDYRVYTYAGNTLGLPANPTGGAQFAGATAGANPARAQRDGVLFTADIWELAGDVAVKFVNPLPATNNIGSLSLQPSTTTASCILLARWTDLNTAVNWNADIVWYNAAGTSLTEPVPNAGFQGLAINHWYRWKVKVNFVSNQILEVSITDLTTSVTVTYNPTDRYLQGGAAGGFPLPSGVRVFAGAAGNVFAADNVVADLAPAIGACCNDATGDCTPNVSQAQCTVAPLRFHQGLACNQISPPCGTVVGACCFQGGSCQDLTGNNCSQQGGRWFNGSCATFACPPDNDLCEQATVVSDGAHPYTTENALSDGPTNPQCVATPAAMTNDVWFQYTASCNGFLTASLCNQTNFDSVIVVYDTDNCNTIRLNLNEVGCDDDGCGQTAGGSEVVDLFVVQGVTYTIRVGGFNGATGSGTLVVKCRDANSGACCHVDGTCTENVPSTSCPAPSRYISGRTCQSPTTCPPAGACCLGVQGCQVMFQDDCTAQGGTFLGINSRCASAPPGNQDCDGNGISNQCEIAQRLQFDCQPNGIPDNCDVNPALGGTSRDCQPDGTPDECQLAAAPPIDNGPLITHPAGGFGGADASALQTALGLNIYGYGHQLAAGNRVADDFTVDRPFRPARVTFIAYQTGSGTTSSINHVNVRIWDGLPGDPGSNIVFGDTTTNRLLSTTWSGIYRTLDTNVPTAVDRPLMEDVVDLSGAPTLPAGTYWLDWQTGGTGASGPWVPPVTILGQTGKPGANGRQLVAAGWQNLEDPAGTPQDVPFVLEAQAGGDCNCNDVPDDCDISGGTSQDVFPVGGNGVPDECERGSPTSAVGACCLPGGGCTDTILRCCNDLGGSFRGVGTACATTQCPSCPTVLGDMDGDGDVDGDDMQRFVACVLAGPAIGAGCACADMDGSGTLTAVDVPAFVTRLRGP